MSLKDSLQAWTRVTADLPWGVQHAMHDALTLVAEGKVQMVHGRDYREGKPCLVNSVAQMLVTGGGQGIPGRHYGPLVSLFDQINAAFQSVPGYNDDTGMVSPAVGEVLVRYFAPLKPQPMVNINEAQAMEYFAENTPYVEPTDAEIEAEWLASLETSTPVETNAPTEARQ